MLQSIHIHRFYSRRNANVDSVSMVSFGPGPVLAGMTNFLKHPLAEALVEPEQALAAMT